MGIGDLFHHGPPVCWRRSRRVTGVSRVSVKSDASQSSCSRADCDVRRRSTIHYSDSCFMLCQVIKSFLIRIHDSVCGTSFSSHVS